jgi:hypothetical protein
MMSLRYLFCAVVAVLALIAARLLFWLLAFSIRDDGTLPWYAKWASTPQDTACMHSNLAVGDLMFQEMVGIYPLTYWNRYKLCSLWIRRNPAYWVDYKLGVTIAGDFDFDQDQPHNLEWFEDETKGWDYFLANRKLYEGTMRRKLVQSNGTYFEWWYVKRWNATKFMRLRFGWFLDSTTARPIKSGERRSLQVTISPWLGID